MRLLGLTVTGKTIRYMVSDEVLKKSEEVLLKEISSKIREKRTKKGISEYQLAKEANMSRLTVKKIERAEDIRITSLARILRALNINYFFE